MAGDNGIGKSPTFVVGADRQRGTLETLRRREQHFSEHYQKNKPLCFNARAYQQTHPRKAAQQAAAGQRDADATLVSPMLVGVADGVSQIEEFGIDASELPNELLDAVEELAVGQLLPDNVTTPQDKYRGPISLLREAYDSTESLGSTTVLLGIMDNSTRIHGKLHPMIAVLSLGDCEILILRRDGGQLLPVFHTEMQRIDGHCQAPLQLARVDEQIDPDFDESIAAEVIEKGSAVHCVSAYEGDIVVLGSDGVFDNLFVDEIVAICNGMLPPFYPGAKFAPTDRALLGEIARHIVLSCHEKTEAIHGVYKDSPIGRGGKVDDTSCVVGEVVEWTAAHSAAWRSVRRKRQWQNLFTCGGNVPRCDASERRDHYEVDARSRNYPSNPNGSFSTYWGSFSEYNDGSRYGGASQYGDYDQAAQADNASFASSAYNSDYNGPTPGGRGYRPGRRPEDGCAIL